MKVTPSVTPSNNFCVRNKNKFWIIAIAVILITSATGYKRSIQENTNTPVIKQADHAMMSGSTSMTPSKMELQGYQKYSPELVRVALASEKKVVLFFAASWCPTCKALNTEILSHLTSIPPDTLIALVDYDDSTELKQKYGVTTQHTTVMLGTGGTLKSKKLGARNIAEILIQ